MPGALALAPTGLAHARRVLTLLLLILAGCGETESPTETTDTPVATTVTLSAATLSFSSLEDTQQLTATVRDQNGATMSGTPVTWVSAASNVASVSSTGLVTAVADGTATVTATSGSASETASVTVQVAASITLSPSSLVLAGPGTTETVTASVIDAGGSEIVNPDLTWSSSDESIATVSSSGLVTAVAIGSATITVTNGGLTVTQVLPITVNPPPVRLLHIAFIGDQGWEPAGRYEGPRAVLRLIREEGVDAVFHQGDFDYGQNPQGWMAMIDEELGQNFPYFASVGNHDLEGGAWGEEGGYRDLLEDRASRLGYTWTGIYGEQASLSFEGIRLLLGAPGISELRRERTKKVEKPLEEARRVEPDKKEVGSFKSQQTDAKVLASIAENQRNCLAGTGWRAEAKRRGLSFPPFEACTRDLDIENSAYSNYFAGELATDTATWRICSWHKVQKAMQVGNQADEVGYAVYEACREGGAIIATAHEHSYSRTHLLSDVSEQIVASTSDTLEIAKGRTFVFVSGMGGRGNRSQRREGDWWASIYTATQGARSGALFASFNIDGDPSLAHFYFKDVTGQIVDEFWVRSRVRE